MKTITVQELGQLGENITLIDVREPDEIAEVRVPFAKVIPLSEFADRVDEVPTEGAYIMCHAGGRSARTVTFLEQRGIDATNVDGGIAAWEAAGLPVERG
ncbi:rhodanese-like domain-containing protein [Gulosibacter bifidus]|uniref:Rhodanese-like domain-containing protein n=1 Tax=Gulosibacter bifidus TaxID=272239 RepID=A0ABW5RJK9_9MICO|nr:rhodanese-like domain-containing protein [Gulosibacter bifidus]